MLLLIGGILGFLFGASIISLTAPMLGITIVLFGPIAPLFAPLVTLLAALLGTATFGAALIFTFATVLIAMAIAYTLAAVSLLPGTAAAPTPGVPNPLPPVGMELLMRGFHFGLNGAMNFALVAVLTGSVAIGAIVGTINILAAVPGVSANGLYQAVLGWASWVMPMSWFMTALGLALFIVNLPFAIATFGPAALRFDVTTATFETTGGGPVMFLAGLTGFSGGGFNLGSFTYLVPLPGTGPAAIQTPFTVPGLSAHETGHTLQVAALGGFHGWVNAIDENVPPLARGTLAYGEMIVESHLPRNGLFNVMVWS